MGDSYFFPQTLTIRLTTLGHQGFGYRRAISAKLRVLAHGVIEQIHSDGVEGRMACPPARRGT